MSIGTDFCDVSEVVREEFDWRTYLGSATIVASNWTICPAGPVLNEPLVNGLFTSVEVGPFSDGGVYELENAITLGTGETPRASITIRSGRR